MKQNKTSQCLSYKGNKKYRASDDNKYTLHISTYKLRTMIATTRRQWLISKKQTD